MQKNKLIAFDPGTHETAAVIWDGEKIHFAEKVQNIILCSWLKQHLASSDTLPVYCEMIASYGMPVGSEIFETCLMIGNLQQITSDCNQLFYKVYRKDVKIHLCNSMRAKDGNIRQALIDRFGGPGIKKAPGVTYGLSGDMWSAFAVAVYAFDNHSKVNTL